MINSGINLKIVAYRESIEKHGQLAMGARFFLEKRAQNCIEEL